MLSVVSLASSSMRIAASTAGGGEKKVLAETRLESRFAERPEALELRAFALGVEQPFREAARGLALGDELEAPRAAREVRHRERAVPRHARRGEKHELAGVEVARRFELERKADDVVGQPADIAQGRGGCVGDTGAELHRIDEARHFDRQRFLRSALAHQELGAAFQVFAAGRLAPAVAHPAGDELRLTSAAGAVGACVRPLAAGYAA